MSEVNSIIRANNRFWADIFYSHYESCDDYDLCLLPEFSDYVFLNSASVVTRRGLDRLSVPVWTHDETDAAVIMELQRRGYQIVEEETEYWNALDLRDSTPSKTQFLTCDIADIGFSEDLKTFCDISTQTNSAGELSEHVYAKLQSSSAEYLLLTYKSQAAATMCISHVDNRSFICLGGVLPEFRRLGLFLYLRLECVERARAKGSRFLISNTAKVNKASLNASHKIGSYQTFTHSLWIPSAK